MQRTSETIASLAAALAKAQIELVNPEKSLVGAIEPAAGEGNFAFRDRVVKFLRGHGYNDHIHKSIETKDLAEGMIASPVRSSDAAANRKAEYEWEINVNKTITRLKNAAVRGKGKRKSGMLSDLAEKHCRPGGSREFYFWAVRESGPDKRAISDFGADADIGRTP